MVYLPVGQNSVALLFFHLLDHKSAGTDAAIHILRVCDETKGCHCTKFQFFKQGVPYELSTSEINERLEKIGVMRSRFVPHL